MAEHPLIGSYVRIKYHSAFSPHVMTLPTNDWAGPSTSLDPGIFTTWAAGSIAGDTMITDLCNVLKTMWDSTVTIDQGEIWIRPTLSDRPRLGFIQQIGIPGTSSLVGWIEAVQRTYFCRDAGNNAFKLVLLDSPTDNLYGKYYTLTTPENAIIAELTASGKGWATRAKQQISYFRSLTICLNERLRREYHLR